MLPCQIPLLEREERPSFLFSAPSARRNATLAKLLYKHDERWCETAFNRPVTGDYPSVVKLCYLDHKRMLFYQSKTSNPALTDCLKKRPRENSANLSLASAQSVQVRSMKGTQLPPSNLHSDTHREAYMASIDRLMVAGEPSAAWQSQSRGRP